MGERADAPAGGRRLGVARTTLHDSVTPAGLRARVEALDRYPTVEEAVITQLTPALYAV